MLFRSPAAKLARREGVDFVLDPMWQAIPAGLNEHIDGLRTTCARPKKKADGAIQPVVNGSQTHVNAMALPVPQSAP